MNNIEKFNKNSNVFLIIKGYVIALIITIVGLFIYATVLVKTNIQESTINSVIITITGVSILIGSSVCSLKIKKRGILNGIIVGGIYLLSLYVISSFMVGSFSVSVNSLIMSGVAMMLGAIGGIIGVNVGK